MTAQPTDSNARRITATAFVAGAVVGGVLAGALGGLLGAGLGLAALAVARASWPAPLRTVSALLILVTGFGALWVGAGFVRAALRLIAAGAQVR